MSSNPNHHLAIHGHFYQPPRENPWLGVIEFQESALPFHDWNARINAECYTPLTSSPLLNRAGQVYDLFNCYPHLSFNFGATLLTWIVQNSPETLARLRVADRLARETYQQNGAAMAQVYNHVILPLADGADARTQIVWGLTEFQYRFGRAAESIWLSETAINMATVNCLIDHGVKFVILSPYQASYCRPLGTSEWQGVPDGTLDTRVPYRLFAVDGAGNTHFDRYLDIFFYDKTLSTKVSFEHLLADAENLLREATARFAADATLPQLVLIATDGEIYGHHEPFGNRALAHFQAECLQTPRVTLTNLTQFWREHPPQWEVRLWEGLDGKGSSWSCNHGVARWESNCGCGRQGNDNQEWRAPLRAALNNLRGKIKEIFRRELGGLVWDIWDARNDYIRVVLAMTTDNLSLARAEFIARHAQKPLNENEQIKLWSLLEAERYAMLMFTSCGWFFHELSGIEPVQNLRYALRAMELVMPYTTADLNAALENELAAATSPMHIQGNGRDLWRNQVLPSRYDAAAIAAVNVIARLLALPASDYQTQIVFDEVNETAKNSGVIWGKLTAIERATTARQVFNFVGGFIRSDGTKDEIRVVIREIAADNWCENITATTAAEILRSDDALKLTALPFADRQRFAEHLLHKTTSATLQATQKLFAELSPLLQQYVAYNLPLPTSLRQIAEAILGGEISALIDELNANFATPKNLETIEKILAVFTRVLPLNLNIPPTAGAFTLTAIIERELRAASAADKVEQLSTLLSLADLMNLPLRDWDRIRDAYWQTFHAATKPEKARLRRLSKMFALILHNE